MEQRFTHKKNETRIPEENLGGFYVFSNEKGVLKTPKALTTYTILKTWKAKAQRDKTQI